jgi:hypothetical protein
MYIDQQLKCYIKAAKLLLNLISLNLVLLDDQVVRQKMQMSDMFCISSTYST